MSNLFCALDRFTMTCFITKATPIIIIIIDLVV